MSDREGGTLPMSSREAPPLAVETRALVKTFGEGELSTTVIRGVDLAVPRGTFAAVTGPSGSGKSTLLSMIGTLLRPTSGALRIAGRDVTSLDEAALSAFRNRNLGFVFQFHHLLPDFTALENVMFPSFAEHGRRTAAARRRATELLERVGLKERIDFRATKLSGGQMQRVAIARAVMMHPELVLADEPTGNLDRRSSDEAIALMRRIADEEGTTFVISTHDERIANMCSMRIHVVDGRLADAAPGADGDSPVPA
jgi:lipoprotein-releasing system ATP-binding protein